MDFAKILLFGVVVLLLFGCVSTGTTKLNDQGLEKFNKGDYAGALSDYNQAINKIESGEYAKDSFVVYTNRGDVKYVLKDYSGAMADYSKALELNPKHALAYNNRALLKQFALKDYPGAISDLSKAIEVDPNYDAAYSNRGALEYKLGYFVPAQYDINKGHSLNPSLPDYTQFKKIADLGGADCPAEPLPC